MLAAGWFVWYRPARGRRAGGAAPASGALVRGPNGALRCEEAVGQSSRAPDPAAESCPPWSRQTAALAPHGPASLVVRAGDGSGLRAIVLRRSSLRALPICILVAVLVWWYPAIATVRSMWTILQRVPDGVRPGILESWPRSLKVAAVIAASDDRTYRQSGDAGELVVVHQRLPLLPSIPVGVRHGVDPIVRRNEGRTDERPHWRLDPRPAAVRHPPTLDDRKPPTGAKRPTHEAWIGPWVDQLTKREVPVRFNVIDEKPPRRSRSSDCSSRPRTSGSEPKSRDSSTRDSTDSQRRRRTSTTTCSPCPEAAQEILRRSPT